MAIVKWRGDAQKIKQVDTVTYAGTPASGNTVTLTINGKDLTYTLDGSDTTTTVATAMAALIGQYNNNIPEWAEVSAESAANVITITGHEDGRPITISESDTGGGITQALASVTDAEGPNHWDIAENWEGGAVPGAGDDILFEDNDVDCLYGLNDSGNPSSIRIRASYTGRIGLATKNDDYFEYRTTSMELNVATWIIGEGEGPGSPRLRLGNGGSAATVTVYKTADPEDDNQAFIFEGTSVSNVMRVYRGSVGIGTETDGDSSTIATLHVGYVDDIEADADVVCGRSVTLTNVAKTGGKLVIEAATTTILQDAGEIEVKGSGIAASLVLNGGTCDYNSTGAITALHVGSQAAIDFSGIMPDVTVTNCNLYAGASLRDPFRRVIWTNPIELTRCSLLELEALDLGTHITLAPTDA